MGVSPTESTFPPVSLSTSDSLPVSFEPVAALSPTEVSRLDLPSSQQASTYRPSQMIIDLILSGKLDYLRMDPRSEYDLIRPLVWTIAHQEPRSNSQA